MLSQLCRFILGVINPIYNAGILPDADIKGINRLHTMNAFYGICCALALCYCTYYVFFTKNIVAFGIIFLGGLLCRVVIYLNAKHYYTIANTLGIAATGGIVFAISVNEGLSQGFWLYYLVTPLMTLSFFANYDKKIPTLSFAFYAMLFVCLVAAYLSGNTDETTKTGFTLILFANFLVVLVFIFFFTYNFQQISNQSYENIAAQNEVLVEKNAKIDELVTSLNDRVKNNIQVMSILSEIDMFNNPDPAQFNYTKRYAMRLKILDLTYKMVHEEHIEKSLYYRFFLEGYAQNLQKVLPTYISTATIAAAICPKTPLNPKHFDAIMILYNEVLLYLLFGLEFVNPISLHLVYKIDENENNILEFVFKNYNFATLKTLALSTAHIRFAASQRVKIECIVDSEEYHVVFKPL